MSFIRMKNGNCWKLLVMLLREVGGCIVSARGRAGSKLLSCV